MSRLRRNTIKNVIETIVNKKLSEQQDPKVKEVLKEFHRDLLKGLGIVKN